MEQYVLYVQDTETTGLEVGINEIIELSLIRIFLESDNLEGSQKTWLLRATKPETIQESALQKNGHKREDILHQTKFGRENYKNPADVLPEIEEWISEDNMSAHDRVFAGQNPRFDFDHMLALWEANNAADTFPFLTGHNKLILDTKELSLFFDVCLGRKRERYNLSSLVKAFSVKKRTAHRGDEDALMTRDLLLKQISAASPSIKQFFTDVE